MTTTHIKEINKGKVQSNGPPVMREQKIFFFTGTIENTLLIQEDNQCKWFYSVCIRVNVQQPVAAIN